MRLMIVAMSMPVPASADHKETMEINTDPYQGPEWDSQTPCTVCNKPLKNRVVNRTIVLCKHDFWQYDETGATLTDSTCSNCFWSILGLHADIEDFENNYQP